MAQNDVTMITSQDAAEKLHQMFGKDGAKRIRQVLGKDPKDSDALDLYNELDTPVPEPKEPESKTPHGFDDLWRKAE